MPPTLGWFSQINHQSKQSLTDIDTGQSDWGSSPSGAPSPQVILGVSSWQGNNQDDEFLGLIPTWGSLLLSLPFGLVCSICIESVCSFFRIHYSTSGFLIFPKDYSLLSPHQEGTHIITVQSGECYSWGHTSMARSWRCYTSCLHVWTWS